MNRVGRPTRYLAGAAVLVVVVGMVGAVFAAGSVARSNAARSSQAFGSSAEEIASTLQLAIQHEEDLIISSSAFFSGHPKASNADFRDWAADMHAFSRYPELVAFGIAVLVPAAELPAFAARALTSPTGPLAADGTYQVVPPGNRASYCLPVVGLNRVAGQGPPAGLDFCAGLAGPAWLASRDSGRSLYVPFALGKDILLEVTTPIYRGASVPTMVQDRRKAFAGWVGSLTKPHLILERALGGQPDLAVTLRYHVDSSDASFSSGKIPAGAVSRVIDLHNGWTVQVFGLAESGNMLTDGIALMLLVGGSLLSLSLAALVFLLATGRARALRLVQERTAELRGAQAQLVEAARQAGMAEIATNVLHNVGNVLNSVNVSANLVSQKVKASKSGGLMKAVALMNEHRDDLGFLSTDVRGKALPGYLETLAATLASERESVDGELGRLTKGVAHIKEIVAAQQSLAGVSGVVESVRVGDLLDDALRMAGIDEDEVRVVRDVPADPLVALDRHRVLLILLNLMSNAQHAMKANGDRPRELSLRAEVVDGQGLSITVADSGVGIPPENLAKIFVHGFTTHTNGHGFGLHSSAVAAGEMGGALTVNESVGSMGAAFTLQVPLDRVLVSA